MANQQFDDEESAVERHVRAILAQIGALKRRKRAQERSSQSGSGDTIEVDRDHGQASEIDGTDPPS